MDLIDVADGRGRVERSPLEHRGRRPTRAEGLPARVSPRPESFVRRARPGDTRRKRWLPTLMATCLALGAGLTALAEEPAPTPPLPVAASSTTLIPPPTPLIPREAPLEERLRKMEELYNKRFESMAKQNEAACEDGPRPFQEARRSDAGPATAVADPCRRRSGRHSLRAAHHRWLDLPPVSRRDSGENGPRSAPPEGVLRPELSATIRLRVAVGEPGVRDPVQRRGPGRFPDLRAAEPEPRHQRPRHPPGADLFQRAGDQAHRVPDLVPENQQQLRPPQRLPQLPLRRTPPAPDRPLPGPLHLRMGEALELGVSHPRAGAVRGELRAEPPGRPDGLGQRAQESPRIRRGDLRRPAQLLPGLQLRQGRHGLRGLPAVLPDGNGPEDPQRGRLGRRGQGEQPAGARPAAGVGERLREHARARATGDSLIAVPFLAFNNNVRERGDRKLWELHATYFYKGLSVLGAWDSGINSYRADDAERPCPCPCRCPATTSRWVTSSRGRRWRSGPWSSRSIPSTSARASSAWVPSSSRPATANSRSAGRSSPPAWPTRTSGRTGPTSSTRASTGISTRMSSSISTGSTRCSPSPCFYRPGPGLQKTSDLFWLRLQLYY